MQEDSEADIFRQQIIRMPRFDQNGPEALSMVHSISIHSLPGDIHERQVDRW